MKVKCNFFSIPSDVQIGGHYVCGDAIINPTAEELTVDGVELVASVNAFGDSVYGAHEEGKTDDSVQSFTMANSELHYIPEHLSRVFKNLLKLSFTSTHFKSLNARDLKPFPQLKVLNVISGKIKTLDGDLFKHTPNMVGIDFDSNEIAYIGSGFLNGLTNLDALSMRYNQCVDLEASTIEEVLLVAPKLNNLCIRGMSETLPTTTAETTACPCTEQVEALNQANELVAGLQQAIGNCETKGEGLFGQIIAKDSYIKALEDSIVEIEKNYYAVYDQNVELAEEIETKIQEITTITEEFTETIAEKETLIEGLQDTITEKNQQIDGLQFDKDELTGQKYGYCNA